MINDLRIHLSIIMYMFGCFSIMVYNIIIIYHKKRSSKAMRKNTVRWIKTIYQQFTGNNPAIISSKHKKHLRKGLVYVEKLIAFSHALNFFNQVHSRDLYNKYLSMLAENKVFQKLALTYRKRKNEERAYFAYFVSMHPSVAISPDGICKTITDTLVSFIVKADIYCRINVLKALCRVGDMHGIISVLQFLSDKPNYIHHNLLAEDLYNFAGDKDALAQKLWGRHELWNDNIVLGVVTFIAMFSDKYKADFLPVLQNQSANADIRLAIIHYYKEYTFKPAQPILIEYLNQTENYDMAMEAASCLSAYPGPTTSSALVAALKSESWNVQYNAASSLVELGAHLESLNTLFQSHKKDALRVIEYKLAHSYEEKYMNARKVPV